MRGKQQQVNCVDTGWVTDMAPLGAGAKAKTHRTHVGPPLDEEDGAARVVDPIFNHLAELESDSQRRATDQRVGGDGGGRGSHAKSRAQNAQPPTGVFYKDYRASPW